MPTLGIDPGATLTGYGLVETEGDELRMVDCGCIRTKADGLKELYHELKNLIQKYHPADLAIEKLFFAANRKTALAVGQARGMALLAAAEMNVRVSEYTPLEVKSAITGYGRADKKQVQNMVKNLLKLKSIPKPDDAADALAVAICHLHSRKMKAFL